jgi:hypothetical protein
MAYPQRVYELLGLLWSRGGRVSDAAIPNHLRNALLICRRERALIARIPVVGVGLDHSSLPTIWKLTQEGAGVFALYLETQAERTPPVAEIGKQPPPRQEPPRPRLTVNLNRMEITLDGVVMECDSPQALRLLNVYASHPGEWILAAELTDYDAQLDGAKPHVLKKYLPDSVRSLLQSHKQKGSRLSLPEP